MADVLSQSQIDALLKSMQDGPPKEEKAEPEVAEVSAQETKKEEVPPAKKEDYQREDSFIEKYL